MTENEKKLLSLNKELLTLCIDIFTVQFREGHIFSKRLIQLEEKLNKLDPEKQEKSKKKTKRSIDEEKSNYRTETN